MNEPSGYELATTSEQIGPTPNISQNPITISLPLPSKSLPSFQTSPPPPPPAQVQQPVRQKGLSNKKSKFTIVTGDPSLMQKKKCKMCKSNECPGRNGIERFGCLTQKKIK